MSSGAMKYSCKVCGNKFRELHQLKDHLLIHTGDKPHRCDMCGHRFRQQSQLNGHKRLHLHDGNQHKCKACGKVFLTKGQLASHLDVHMNTPIHDCGTCGASFSDNISLNTHRLIHISEASSHVDRSDQSEHTFSEHQLTACPSVMSDTTGYTCNVCGKSFTKRRNLTYHLLVHAEASSYSCTTCGKHFAHKASLVVHIRVHTGERPFPCGKCGKRFKQKGQLKAHMASIHQFASATRRQIKRRKQNRDEMPFVCNVCGNGFAKKHYMLTHKRKVHAVVKPFPCDVCGQAFVFQCLLRYHKGKCHKSEAQTKTNAKDMAVSKGMDCSKSIAGTTGMVVRCPQCGKHFMDRHSLKRHIRTMLCDSQANGSHDSNAAKPWTKLKTDTKYTTGTASVRLRCRHCGRRFLHQYSLKRHVKTEHGMTSFGSQGNKSRDNTAAQSRPRTELKTHTEDLAGVKNTNFNCHQCGKKFIHQYFFKRHVKARHRRIFSHNHDKTFRDNNTIKSEPGVNPKTDPKHITVTKAMQFSCNQCSKRFAYQYLLKLHVKIGHGMIVQRSISAKSHMAKCTVKIKKIDTCISQTVHPKVALKNQHPRYVCNVCAKPFQSFPDLMKHAHRHKEFKAYKCKTCGKTLSRKSIYLTHQQLHTGKKPFMCNLCKETFTFKYYAVKHLKRHPDHESYAYGPCEAPLRHGENEIYPEGAQDTKSPPGNMNVSHGEPTRSKQDTTNAVKRQVREIKRANRVNKVKRCFVCSVCDAGFAKNHYLLTHKRVVHAVVTPFACAVCGNAYALPYLLRYHKDKCHKSEDKLNTDTKEITDTQALAGTESRGMQFHCSHCRKGFGCRPSLKHHKRSHHGRTQHGMTPHHSHGGRFPDSISAKSNMDMCTVRITKIDTNIKQSLKTVHSSVTADQNPRYVCMVCAKSFHSVLYLTKHKKLHKEHKPYKCKTCGKTLSRKTVFLDHQQLHTGKKPFKCDFCKETFAIKRYVLEHLNKHPDHGSYTYDPREAPTRHYDNGMYPGETQGTTNSQPISATVSCKETTLAKQDTASYVEKEAHEISRKHAVTTAKRPFECNVCGLGFTTMHCMLSHKRLTHAAVKRFSCEICGKSFFYQSLLRYHQDKWHKTDAQPKAGTKYKTKSITGTKGMQINCRQCGKRFVDQYSLKLHVKNLHGRTPHRIHRNRSRESNTNGELKTDTKYMDVKKEFVCNRCGKCYSVQSSLNRHIKMRHGKTPHRIHRNRSQDCVISVQSKTNGELKTDTKHKDGNKEFNCNQCVKCYSVQSSLNRHVKVHHGTSPSCSHVNGSQDRVAAKYKMAECRVMTNKLNPHHCGKCGIAFSDIESLKQHSATHLELDDEFRKMSSSEGYHSDADSHQMPCQEKEMFTCNSCGATFNKQEDMVTHLLMHIE